MSFLPIAIPAAISALGSFIGSRQANNKAKKDARQQYDRERIAWDTRQQQKRDVYGFAKSIAQARGYNFPSAAMAALESSLNRPFPGQYQQPYGQNSFGSGLRSFLSTYGAEALARNRNAPLGDGR